MKTDLTSLRKLSGASFYLPHLDHYEHLRFRLSRDLDCEFGHCHEGATVVISAEQSEGAGDCIVLILESDDHANMRPIREVDPDFDSNLVLSGAYFHELVPLSRQAAILLYKLAMKNHSRLFVHNFSAATTIEPCEEFPGLMRIGEPCNSPSPFATAWLNEAELNMSLIRARCRAFFA